MIYDVAVIGGGPGGYAAAFEAVRYGLSTILFEKELVGGTCLNRGCVPTKYLAHVAKLGMELSHAAGYGLDIQYRGIDFRMTQQKNHAIVEELRNGLSQKLADCNVAIVNGEASLIDKNLILCGNVPYETRNVIIASGSRPIRLREHMLTSDEVLKLDKIPASVSIIGGGGISAEFAEILNGLGANVSIYIRGERILRNWDKDIAVGLTQSMKKRGIKIISRCDEDALGNVRDEITVSAVGRKPVLDHMNRLLFSTDGNGGILTDPSGQTKTKGIYAVGDVVSGSPMLAHTAMEQGIRAVCHIRHQQSASAGAVIRCIYTTPEIACVGLTVEEALLQGRDAVSARQTMYANARTLISTRERGFIKIVAEKGTRRLLGAQLMCERASDIISELAAAVQNGFTIDDMLKTTRPHPSYAEAVSEALGRAREALDSGI